MPGRAFGDQAPVRRMEGEGNFTSVVAWWPSAIAIQLPWPAASHRSGRNQLASLQRKPWSRGQTSWPRGRSP